MLIYESVLVGHQSHTGMPQVAINQAKPMKNIPHWVKMGALWNYHCRGWFLGGCCLVHFHIGTMK